MIIRSRLFTRGGFNGQPGLDDVFRLHTTEVIRKIQAISKIEQLTDEFLERIVKESLVEPIVLDFDEMTYSPRTEEVPAEFFDSFEFNMTPGRLYPKTVVRISVPYKGDRNLFYLSPNMFGTTRPSGEVVGSRVQFDILMKGYDDDEARCKSEMEQNKEQLIWYVNASTAQVKNFNQKVPEEIKAAFKQKLEELTKQHSFLDGLGIKREAVTQSTDTSEVNAMKSPPRAAKSRSNEPKVIIQIIEKMYVKQLNQTNNNTGGDVNNAIQSD